MGLSLGLIGGGGSILTVPIFVYLFAVEPITATAYSLFVVGSTSVIGGFSHMRQGNVSWRTAVIFGVPSLISVFLTRAYLVPAIPDVLFSAELFTLSKASGMLVLFAVLMVLAAISMIRKKKVQKEEDKATPTNKYLLILLEGAGVGMITGLVGAGGGFLIIPALVLLANLPMKKAVGTSLVIIAVKSLFGFVGDLSTHSEIDWNFLLVFSAISMGGIIMGTMLSKRMSGEFLKPAFGWFVLVMGVYVLSAELIF